MTIRKQLFLLFFFFFFGFKKSKSNLSHRSKGLPANHYKSKLQKQKSNFPFYSSQNKYPFGSTFRPQKAAFYKKLGLLCVWFKKLRFGPRQKTRSKRANIMDRRRSINQNAHARLNKTVGLDGQL